MQVKIVWQPFQRQEMPSCLLDNTALEQTHYIRMDIVLHGLRLPAEGFHGQGIVEYVRAEHFDSDLTSFASQFHRFAGIRTKLR